MCILRFHARAGYLQHYETLLKELNAHPVPPDQYEVERVALADRNLNLPCESGLRFPPSPKDTIENFGNIVPCTCTYCHNILTIITLLLCHDVSLSCTYIVHTRLYLYIRLSWCVW